LANNLSVLIALFFPFFFFPGFGRQNWTANSVRFGVRWGDKYLVLYSCFFRCMYVQGLQRYFQHYTGNPCSAGCGSWPQSSFSELLANLHCSYQETWSVAFASVYVLRWTVLKHRLLAEAQFISQSRPLGIGAVLFLDLW